MTITLRTYRLLVCFYVSNLKWWLLECTWCWLMVNRFYRRCWVGLEMSELGSISEYYWPIWNWTVAAIIIKFGIGITERNIINMNAEVQMKMKYWIGDRLFIRNKGWFEFRISNKYVNFIAIRYCSNIYHPICLFELIDIFIWYWGSFNIIVIVINLNKCSHFTKDLSNRLKKNIFSAIIWNIGTI